MPASASASGNCCILNYTNIELILRITHSYQLNRLLTKQVLDVKANHQHAGEAALNLLLQASFNPMSNIFLTLQLSHPNPAG